MCLFFLQYTKMIIDAHYGSILALQRSPFFEDIILSVGEWSFKIWKEGLSSPIFSSAAATTYLTQGCWSPTRPGVIITARQDGVLEIWDLLDRSHEASMVATVSSSSITSLKFYEKASAATQRLAAGDAMGKLHILELPRNLRRPMSHERELMKAFCDRELDRVKYLETTLQMFEDYKEEASGDLVDMHNQGNDQEMILDLIESSEQEYMKLEKEFREKLLSSVAVES